MVEVREPRDLRDDIVAAAEGCFAKYGLRRATMEDVARAAGVSRKTVYNHFENKDALIGEVVRREAHEVVARARAALRLSESPARLIVNAELALLDAAKASTYVGMLLGPEAIAVTGGVVDRSADIAAVQAGYWRPILEPLAERGQLRTDDLDELIEWLTFLHFVLVARPSTFDGRAERTRAMLQRYLVPGIVRPTST